ncbi:MAG: ATP-dependent Clp protease proteolytic subunit [Fibromonadaceae bacterium]|jgi:ATP-dependent Clp endopeptidase proteolytic subunit ClpP|nr:ATP-dependent Clp protease proteolytic subunit [Fibromonadaceae bacterium]
MKEAYIRFMAPVNPQTTDSLIKLIDDRIRNGYQKIHLLISSPGGSVFHGLSLYNFLYGIPLEVDTYNFGSVDSIGVILFCAGKNRYSVPNARFLIHGVNFQVGGPTGFDEKMLEEHLKSLQIDQQNIAKVIAFTTGKKEDDIKNDMHNRTTLSPEEAKKYGLVTEIKDKLMPANAEFYSIGEMDNHQMQFAPQMPHPFFLQQLIPQAQGVPVNQNLTVPLIKGYTSMYDRGFAFTNNYR